MMFSVLIFRSTITKTSLLFSGVTSMGCARAIAGAPIATRRVAKSKWSFFTADILSSFPYTVRPNSRQSSDKRRASDLRNEHASKQIESVVENSARVLGWTRVVAVFCCDVLSQVLTGEHYSSVQQSLPTNGMDQLQSGPGSEFTSEVRAGAQADGGPTAGENIRHGRCTSGCAVTTEVLP
jgi:hypothetical protein